MEGVARREIDGIARYDAWWQSEMASCVKCKQGPSSDAIAIRAQGESFRPMRNFGPDRAGLPVRYLLVAMEPSESFYNSKKRKIDPSDFEQWWAAARNFGGISNDGVLQFAAREWLCERDETFLLTDMAKCPAEKSIVMQTQRHRWNTCADHLRREAALFDLRAVVAVGNDASHELKQRPWVQRKPHFRVIHYSGVAIAHHLHLLGNDRERLLRDVPIDEFRAFLLERKKELNSLKAAKLSAAVEPKVKDIPNSRILLAVYRKQFTDIKEQLATI